MKQGALILQGGVILLLPCVKCFVTGNTGDELPQGFALMCYQCEVIFKILIPQTTTTKTMITTTISNIR
jgi:hypothetical protein